MISRCPGVDIRRAAVEYHNMGKDFIAGEYRRVVVITECDGQRESLPAYVLSAAGSVLELEIKADPRWAERRALGVIAEAPNGPLTATVADGVVSGSVLKLRLASRWRPSVDRRGSLRLPVHLSCELVSGENSTPGLCLDITLSGAAIECREWTEQVFRLRLASRSGPVELNCRAVNIETSLGGSVVHCAFRPMSLRTRAVLVDLVETARREFEEAQRYLATRADDPQLPATHRSA